MKRVDHVLVGYDIARTSPLTLGTNAASSTLAEGEVVVLDKYGKLLPAGKTISDSDIIYLGLGTKTTYTEKGSGSGYTRRSMKLSGPIVAYGVKSYKKMSYTAPIQCTATAATTGLSPSTTAGAYDYVLRIIYKDNLVASQTPSQFIQEYRVTSDATLTSLQVLYDAFRTLIAADNNARVAGSGTTSLILTGLTNTDAAMNDIDGYMFVDFDVIFYKVQLTGVGAGTQSAAGPAVTYLATKTQGEGTWKQVRDLEKAAKAYTGIVNWIDFPVPSNTTDWYTVLGKTYNQIVIEHDVPFTSSDMNYTKTARQATILAFPIAATQAADVISILNPWMASTPAALQNI